MQLSDPDITVYTVMALTVIELGHSVPPLRGSLIVDSCAVLWSAATCSLYTVGKLSLKQLHTARKYSQLIIIDIRFFKQGRNTPL